MTSQGPIFAVATWLVPLIIAITFHEVAHGRTARFFGDPTAANAGRLSLNPLRHVDLIGTIILPLALALAGAPVFGWAKPVPVNMRRLRNPRWHGMLVTAAGPAMNYALALIGVALFALMLSVLAGTGKTMLTPFLLANLYNFVMVNLFLGTFNLLPIPPLDGGHILQGLLPRRLGESFAKIGRFGFVILLFLLVVMPMIWPGSDILGRLVEPPVRIMSNAMFGLFGLNHGA